MRLCDVAGCYREHEALGFCSLHYKRLRRCGDVGLTFDPLTPPVCVCERPEPDEIGECAVCARPYKPGLLECRARWRLYLSGDNGKESDGQFQDQ